MPPGAITTGAEPGSVLIRLSYEALGRLARVEGPNGYSGWYEEYVYDGSRRIQTLAYNPGACSGFECSVTNFVYGPDYVDEFVCQIIQPTLTLPPTQTHYYIQDDNYNVVGLVSTTGEVVQQYVHSPYGRPLIAESFGQQTFTNTVGHQGLFAG